MVHPEFPYVSLLAAVLVLVPLPWHWRAGNVATLSIIAWLFAVNVIYGVDAIIWGSNAIIVVPVWCDISESVYHYIYSFADIAVQRPKLLSGQTLPCLPRACVCASISSKSPR